MPTLETKFGLWLRSTRSWRSRTGWSLILILLTFYFGRSQILPYQTLYSEKLLEINKALIKHAHLQSFFKLTDLCKSHDSTEGTICFSQTHCSIKDLEYNELLDELQGCYNVFEGLSFHSMFKDVRWTAYIGDSLLRSPFYEWVDRIVPSNWEVEKRTYLREYHNDRILCCQDYQNVSTCTFEVRGLDEPFYNDTTVVQRVNQLFSSYGTDLSNSTCITFNWNQNATMLARENIKGYLQQPLPPDAIILNPGIHMLLKKQPLDLIAQDLEALVQTSREALSHQVHPYQTKVLLHETTFLHEEMLTEWKKFLSNENVSGINRLLHKVNENFAHISPPFQILPTYSLTRDNPHLIPLGDGIHYTGQSADFNLLWDLMTITGKVNWHPCCANL